MNNATNIIDTIGYVLGTLGIGSFVFSFLRYSNYKETVQLQNDSIKALQQNAIILQAELEKHKKTQIDSVQAIARLQGQVDLYKELPLRELADGITKLTKSNDEILNTLKNSAIVLDKEKTDGGLLVKTEGGSPLDVEVK